MKILSMTSIRSQDACISRNTKIADSSEHSSITRSHSWNDSFFIRLLLENIKVGYIATHSINTSNGLRILQHQTTSIRTDVLQWNGINPITYNKGD